MAYKISVEVALSYPVFLMISLSKMNPRFKINSLGAVLNFSGRFILVRSSTRVRNGVPVMKEDTSVIMIGRKKAFF